MKHRHTQPIDRWSVIHYSLFLDAVEELEPKVKRDLLELLPLYRSCLRASKGNITEFFDKMLSSAPDEIMNGDVVLFYEGLRGWAEKYNLSSNILFIRFALHFLDEVYEFESDASDEQYTDVFIRLSDGVTTKEDSELSDFDLIFPFSFSPLPRTVVWEKLKLEGRNLPEYWEMISHAESYEGTKENSGHIQLAWNPTEETWAEFNAKVDQMISNYKRAYKKRTDEYLKKHHYKAKIKREELHYKWLVEYHIRGKSCGDISIEYSLKADKRTSKIGYHESTILKAIKQTASLVGLTLRIDHGGRPPKTTKKYRT